MRLVVPENLKEIQIHQYQKYKQIQDANPDSPEFCILKMVEILCGLTQRQALKIPTFELEDTARILTESFLADRKFKQRFTHNGVEYGFIPNLDKMAYGEYMDLSSYLNDDAEMHRFMAVAYRPIEDTMADDLYSIQDYGGSDIYAEQMLSAPVEYALEARVFFWNLAKELMSSMMDSLTQEEMMRMEVLLLQNQALINAGAGIKQSIP